MRTRPLFYRSLPGLASVSVLMAAGVLVCTNGWAQAAPISIKPLSQIPVNAKLQHTTLPGEMPGGRISYQGIKPLEYSISTATDSPVSSTYNAGGKLLTINQKDPAAILNWSSFDISADAKVRINQQSTDVMLNRVASGAIMGKTTIEGVLHADGHVYIYNPNGFIIGKTGVINTNSFFATSLNISDKRFLAGIVAPNLDPVFAADPNLIDPNTGMKGATPGSITVEEGAKITAANGGKIFLIAPNVTNSGTLAAPDGQVVLAAGGKVYLAAPSDTSMRGLLVEVSNDNLSTAGGMAQNGVAGQINVGRGNATMVGLAVNQEGTISATTSINLNGSIYLRARDGASKNSESENAVATNGGQLFLGKSSVTKIDIVDDGTTAPAGPTDPVFKKSIVDLSGKTIKLEGRPDSIDPSAPVSLGAQIIAKGGDVTIAAKADPSQSAIPSTPNSSRVDIGANTVIDVSGSTVTKSMESNVIQVQLLSELAENVLMRDSPLRGKTMNFDIRKGTQIANISPDLAKIEGTVGERTAVGGTVRITSEGEIIQRQGSKSLIDVSGGQINFQAGYVNTTKLTANGALFDVGTASANKKYDGFVNLPNGNGNFEAAYSVGKDAGTIQISAPVIVLQGGPGSLKGIATPGLYQRNVGVTDRPKGGQLIIGGETVDITKLNPGTKQEAGYFGNIVFGGTATKNAIAPDVDSPFDSANPDHVVLSKQLDIDTVSLSKNGFSRITANTVGDIVVAAPVKLAAGGEMNLGAYGNLQFKSGVTSTGGRVTAVTQNKLTVDSGVVFDLAGKWTNDNAIANPARDANGNPSGAIVLKGGALDLTGMNVAVGDDVAANVSGGAWLDNKRKLFAGDAGSISIKAKIIGDNKGIGDTSLQLGNRLTLSAYSLAKGGKLSLQAPNVTIGDVSVNPNDLLLSGKFFEQGGFTNYDIGALGNLMVNPGATITPTSLNWQFKQLNTYQTVASGDMRSVAAPTLLDLAGPQGGRTPTSVTLRAISELDPNAGNLVFGTGAKLRTDPGANVSLLAGQQLTVDGTIDVPAGNITLGLTPGAATPNFYSDKRSIWIGSHAHLKATGSADLLYTNGNGITTGEVLDGGSIKLGRPDGTNINAATGYVVVEQQAAGELEKRGATFDVSGVISDAVRFKSGNSITAQQQVASSGGSIAINAGEGLLIAGTMKGKAGGTGTSAQGGSLSITLDRENLVIPGANPDAARTLTISNGQTAALPSNLQNGSQAGQSTEQTVGGQGQGLVTTASIVDGFDRIAFKSQNVIAFSGVTGPVVLKAKSSLTLDAPVFRAGSDPAAGAKNDVQLNSAYVQLGNADYRYQAMQDSTGGAAKLNVNATTIDLIGNAALQNFGEAKFSAKEDIRLVGVTKVDLSQLNTSKPTDADMVAKGKLLVTGKLELNAAQIYPTTLSDFTLKAQGTTGAPSTLIFSSNGNTTQTPLSAAGKLKGEADNIVQSGRVVAPFGEISLEASGKLEYVPGSVTSVAGTELVPFGRVENGRDWVYDFGNGNKIAFKLNPGSSGNLVENSFPKKSITSTAKNVIVSDGAKLDLSGGGELYGYEFTPGSYGSVNVLRNNTPGSATKVFAINPNFTSSVAPRDFQYGQDGGLKSGDSVYLSGIAGLPAGNYTLLPAQYALLPGGYSITLAPNARDMSASNNVANLDGSMTVAGRRIMSGAMDSRSSGWIVSSGDVVRKRSEIHNYTAGAFFKDQATAAGVTAPMLPSDGGRVAFNATNSLVLNGLVRLGAAMGGRRGSADISAPDIVVVSDANPVQSGNALYISADKLTALGADSLLLGGLRDTQSDGTHVIVGASTVTIKNDSDHPLTGSEIILVARDKVLVDTGSAVKGDRVLSQTPQNLVISDKDTSGNIVGTDGALLRVSAGAAVSVTRNAPSRATGILEIKEGATVAATGSAYLDATKDNKVDGKLDLAKGAALGLGASRISLGNNIQQGIEGLHFDNSALATLSKLSALELNSYTTIDLYGTVNLGGKAMKELTLKGAGIQGFDTTAAFNERKASFAADTVHFGNDSKVTAKPPLTSGTVGAVTVQASDIEFGNNAFAIKGYADTNLNASREARAVGTGKLSTEKNMKLAAGRIVATSVSDTTIQAGGILKLTQVDKPESPVIAAPFGGRLHFKASDTILSDALIQTPSGQIEMVGANGVHITNGEVNASGASVVFGSTTAYAPGGRISLDGGAGKVIVELPATLDVSATGAAAGTLAIKATNGNDGMAQIVGTVKGRSSGRNADGTFMAQGTFVMDVDKMGPVGQFDALNAKLNRAGFTESRNFRVRNDDVTLSAGKRIKAHEVVIATDNGNITIAGKIDASGTKGGSIELYASQLQASGTLGNVVLTNGAELLANSTVAATNSAGSTGDGGRVVIGTGSADGLMLTSLDTAGSKISLDGGLINVLGDGAGQNGSVTLRAPRIGDNDVAVTSMNTTIVGSPEAVIEGYKTYKTNKISEAVDKQNADDSYANLSALPTGKIYTESRNFVESNAASIRSRLGVTDVSIRSGVDVRSDVDLLVSVNENASTANASNRGWNLNAWRFNDGLTTQTPGTLTLRAVGDLVVKGSISDGFVKPVSSTANNKQGMPDWQLDDKASWSYRLVGGADLAAANPLTVIANDAKGDVQFKFARTSGSATDTPVATVRTGTGRIDVSAGRDVVLDYVPNSDSNKIIGATVYTAGKHKKIVDDSGTFKSPQNQNNTLYGAATNAKTLAEFATDGGGISIYASRDVNGAPVPQLINNWLFRQGRSVLNGSGETVFDKVGTTTLNTAWWSRYDYFNQGIATFAGGDVRVTAATGNVKDLSASVATNAYMPGPRPTPTSLVEQGGGDLTVRAGGDILGGTYYVQKGVATLTADGSIKAGSRQIFDSSKANMQPLKTVLAVGDARFDVTAGRGIEMETAFNPMLTEQSKFNSGLTRALNKVETLKLPQYSTFSTYGENSAVNLTSISGDIALSHNDSILKDAGGTDINSINLDGNYNRLFVLQPGSFNANALDGNIISDRSFILSGSSHGQLNLLASKSVALNSDTGSGMKGVVMLDVAADKMSSYSAPKILTLDSLDAENGDAGLLKGSLDGLAAHTSGGLHRGDAAPVRIVALTGDISGSVVLPKKAEITAGRDIKNFGFKIQNLDAADVTRVTAGRDVIDATIISDGLEPNTVQHIVSGPGRVDFTAGRNFDLGDGSGVVTRGNLDNPYLPSGGASINVLAGSNNADYGSFARTFVSGADFTSVDQSSLVGFVRERNPDLSPTISPAEAWSAFKNLTPADQNAFFDAHKPALNKIFFDKLVDSSKIKDLEIFDNQIASLYPVINSGGGNINVFGSQLRTEQGGSIDMFAPGGSVYAGLLSTPAYLKKPAANLGIFTVRGGEIRAEVKTDFQVNQGRVFSLGGGDITLVSQYGDLNAGKGTKSASSAPPPLLTTDEHGNTRLDISGSISGSGIATLKTQEDQPNSNVIAIAPRGTFDAGDAGVRSTGSVQINAAIVLNAGNITASGGVSGAPSLEAAPSSPAAPANSTPKTDDVAKDPNNLPATGAGTSNTLSVDVVGYGVDCTDPKNADACAANDDGSKKN